MSDLDLARKIHAGDFASAERFVNDHYAAVFRLLLRLARHRQEAEDLTQQTFVTARRKITSYKGTSSLRTWVHSIAVNEYRQWYRKRRWTGRVFTERANADLGVQAFESGYVLAQALDRLSEKLREAFVLFEVEELSMNEVAQVLGIPLGTAKGRVATARQQLRLLLEDRIEVRTDELRESTP